MRLLHLGLIVTFLLSLLPLAALAQVSPPPPAGYSSDTSMQGFFRPSSQPRLSLTPFGGGFIAEDYAATYEGAQAEQTLTERIGLVGRITGYQLFITSNATSPLAPSNKPV